MLMTPSAVKSCPLRPLRVRHHTVEHVHPALDAFEDVHRRAYAHQITRTVLRQYGVDHFDHLVHDLRRFAHGQSADGVTVGVVLLHVLRGPGAQVRVGASLHDGEQRLVMAVFGTGPVILVETPVEPPLREAERLGGVFARGVARGAFVEGHHNVGSDRALGVDDAFGREEVLRAVDVRPEMASLLFQLAARGQRKDLKAAAVGEHRIYEYEIHPAT